MVVRLKTNGEKNVLYNLENIFFCIILTQSMGAPGTLAGLLPNTATAVWYAINSLAPLALSAIILCRSRGKVPKIYFSLYVFGIYVFFVGLLVSDFSQYVLVNSGKLLLTMLCSVYIGSTRKKQEAVTTIAISQIIVSLMILYMILIGYYGVAVADGYYSFNLIGLYTTKNSCGYELVFGAVLFYYCFRNSKGLWIRLFWLMLCCSQFTLSIFARTVGAEATGICAILIYEILIRRKNAINLSKLYLGINAAFWVFVGFVLPSAEFILQRFGKSITLTGRTLIWEAIVTYVSGINRWFGYGYGGFWSNEHYTDSLYAVYNQFALKSGLVGGHNLFMELYINIGLFGVLLFVIMVYSVLKKSRQCAVQNMGFEIICLSFLAIRGLIERTLNSATYDTIALFVVFGTLIHTAMDEKRTHQNEEAYIEKQ